MGWLQRRRERRELQERWETLTDEDKDSIFLEQKEAYVKTTKGLVKRRGIVYANKDFPVPKSDLDLEAVDDEDTKYIEEE